MTPKKYKKIIIVLVIVIALLAVRVIFDSKFDDIQNLVKWTNEYKVNHPNASDEAIDKAYKDSMQGLENWIENYKKDHPDASDEEIDKAFKDAWKK